MNIERTWIGDLNLDGVINNADYLLMGSTGSGWQHGDLNYDGKINADDYSLFAYGAAEIAGSRNVSVVPEPGAQSCSLSRVWLGAASPGLICNENLIRICGAGYRREGRHRFLRANRFAVYQPSKSNLEGNRLDGRHIGRFADD